MILKIIGASINGFSATLQIIVLILESRRIIQESFIRLSKGQRERILDTKRGKTKRFFTHEITSSIAVALLIVGTTLMLLG
ncbi:MAG: hypothetical protein ACTSUC_06390 [Promethearchaeota archaeon]